MHLSRCPICHSRISLEALVQDEAGRELMALVARLDTQTGAALVSYLGLFRSARRDLANERALKLARETLALVGSGRMDTTRLAIALSETVEALREKQPRQPLKNHNYLKRVLETVTQRTELPPAGRPEHTGAPSAQPDAPAQLSATEKAVLAIRAVKFGGEE